MLQERFIEIVEYIKHDPMSSRRDGSFLEIRVGDPLTIMAGGRDIMIID